MWPGSFVLFPRKALNRFLAGSGRDLKPVAPYAPTGLYIFRTTGILAWADTLVTGPGTCTTLFPARTMIPFCRRITLVADFSAFVLLATCREARIIRWDLGGRHRCSFFKEKSSIDIRVLRDQSAVISVVFHRF